MGGRGAFNVAVSSAVISSAWSSLALGTGRVKRVSPPATKAAVARWFLISTLTLPVIRVTVASSRAGTVWLKWPP